MNILWNRKVWGYRMYQVEVDGLVYSLTSYATCEQVGYWGSWPNGTQVICYGGVP